MTKRSAVMPAPGSNFSDLLGEIKSSFNSFHASEASIANCVLSDPVRVSQMNISQLADFSTTSVASVVRFSKAIGYKGYPEFRMALVSEVSRLGLNLSTIAELDGGITIVAEALTLNGTGISSGGALRNISGNNSYGGLITLATASRINSDDGTLTLNVASGNGITGTFNITFGGSGNTTVADPIATSTGTLTKDTGSSSVLTLSGTNTYTGITTISAGTISISADANLGTAASLTATQSCVPSMRPPSHK